jgi:hypothetical protein
MGWCLHQPPWSFGFDSQTRGTRENRVPPCVKVPGSSRVPVRDGQTSSYRPRLVVSRSTCPPFPPPTLANSFVIGTAVINSEHGGEGDCVKEGEGGEGDCERERALGVLVVEMLTPWCRAHGSKACGRAARWAVEQTCLEGIPTACCRGGFIQN